MAAAAPPTRRGALIVFEGLDRSGKTTQARRLTEELNAAGRAAIFRRFPDRSLGTGSVIDGYLCGRYDLPDESVHLIFAANRWERAAELREALAAGTHVIVDRYAHSGVAYTSGARAVSARAQPAECARPRVLLPPRSQVDCLHSHAGVVQGTGCGPADA